MRNKLTIWPIQFPTAFNYVSRLHFTAVENNNWSCDDMPSEEKKRGTIIISLKFIIPRQSWPERLLKKVKAKTREPVDPASITTAWTFSWTPRTTETRSREFAVCPALFRGHVLFRVTGSDINHHQEFPLIKISLSSCWYDLTEGNMGWRWLTKI